MKNLKLDTLKKMVSFEVLISEEVIPLGGNVLASGDADTDREAEEDIRTQLNSGNLTAWCSVTVKATLKGTSLEVRDDLSCCSYASEAQLRSELIPEMELNCLFFLQEELEKIAKLIKEAS